MKRRQPARRWTPTFERICEQKRRRVLDAAKKAFAHHGYAGTNVNLVAREAWISVGIFVREPAFFPVCGRSSASRSIAPNPPGGGTRSRVPWWSARSQRRRSCSVSARVGEAVGGTGDACWYYHAGGSFDATFISSLRMV